MPTLTQNLPLFLLTSVWLWSFSSIVFQDASKDASGVDSTVQGAGADASRAAADTTEARTNAVPGQAGGFNLQSEVSEYATEANMQNAADSVFGKQTVRQFAPWLSTA